MKYKAVGLLTLSLVSGLAAIFIYYHPYYICAPCGSDVCPLICTESGIKHNYAIAIILAIVSLSCAGMLLFLAVSRHKKRK